MRVWVGVNNGALRNTVYTHQCVYYYYRTDKKGHTKFCAAFSRMYTYMYTHDLLET